MALLTGTVTEVSGGRSIRIELLSTHPAGTVTPRFPAAGQCDAYKRVAKHRLLFGGNGLGCVKLGP